MDELINEIINMRNEIDRLWEIIDQSRQTDTSGSTTLKERDFERRIGISASRMIKHGWRSAIRPWIDTPRVRNDILKYLGISPHGFLGGFVSGIYGAAVTIILDSLKKLFGKKRSPLLKATEPHEIRHFYPDDYVSHFFRSLESELFRGRGMRVLNREDTRKNEPLARQIQRGVVGL